MEERYKSLAAMKSEPWIEHFKKTVGQSSQWGRLPRPIVIERKAKDTVKANNTDLPLTVVSPIEQYNEMAAAEVTNPPKTTAQSSSLALGAHSRNSTQQKRKSTAQQGGVAKKRASRVKDIFSRHGKQ